MKYFERLDGLRALAVGVVMMSHYAPDGFHLGIPWGGFGVHLFFIISGFLITRILRKAIGKPLSRSLLIFYVRRFLRIFPLYYFCLLWISVLGWGLDFGLEALWHWGYASNWLFWQQGSWAGSISHFWSLAVEEQFYLVWPLLILSVRDEKQGLCVATLLMLSGLIFRLAAPYWLIGETALWQITTLACLESLGLGALLAFCWREMEVSTLGWLNAFSSVLLVFSIVLVYKCQLPEEWRFQAFLVWATVTVWYLSRARNTAMDWFFLNPSVRFLGMISYGLYVWHPFMGILWHAVAGSLRFPEWLEWHWGAIIGKSALTVVFATMTWYGFEKPLLRLKSNFRYA